MLVHKITTGFVIQVFDTEKNSFIDQYFIAEDSFVSNADGSMTPTDIKRKVEKKYLSFDMKKPIKKD